MDHPPVCTDINCVNCSKWETVDHKICLRIEQNNIQMCTQFACAAVHNFPWSSVTTLLVDPVGKWISQVLDNNDFVVNIKMVSPSSHGISSCLMTIKSSRNISNLHGTKKINTHI